jgi:hypothetical protein
MIHYNFYQKFSVLKRRFISIFNIREIHIAENLKAEHSDRHHLSSSPSLWLVTLLSCDQQAQLITIPDNFFVSL